MKLIIVESPTKARTISRFVGKDYKIESSYGHIRDLPSSTLGVDVENDFKPKYVTPRKAQKNVTALKKLAKKVDGIILATDEDREGEAIAWHLTQALGLRDADNNILEEKPVERIVFHEITKHAIEEALQHPRGVDINLVNAQQARRILDRLVGYKLSPFLWKKVMRGLSAGRVQSVALRLIVEREREREQFKPTEYWTIIATLAKAKDTATFEASLYKKDGKTLEKFEIRSEKEAKKIVQSLEGTDWKIANVDRKQVTKQPLPPFTTSTLQQEASRRFGFSAKQTMFLAQQLYEGIELKEGSTGLITYMRTDSVNIAQDAIRQTETFIQKSFGKEYAVLNGRIFKTKSKGAQEAHEAIRPTDVEKTPSDIKGSVDKKQFRLYELIWQRFVASQMQPAVFDATAVDIEVKNFLFRANGQVIRFDGHYKVWPIDAKETLLPELKKNEMLELKKINPLQHFTQPPARFSEAMLIKVLEQYGIGRPSTYAPIISTLDSRGYTTKDDKRRLAPTEVGIVVNDLLVEHFPEIVDIQFTATMEEQLDEIAEGKTAWTPVIKEFYNPFAKHLEQKLETVKKRDMTEPTDEICETCGKPMVIKHGRFGKFIACSGFPDCKTTKALPPKSLNIPCPECHEGEIVERWTRKRRLFFGCSRYPTCKYATWKKPEAAIEAGKSRSE